MPNGKRLTSGYPRSQPIATEHVPLEQRPRANAPHESTIPEFLRDSKVWVKDNG